MAKSDEYDSLKNKFVQKAEEIKIQERERWKEKEAKLDEEFSQTEYRKIEFQIIDEGWKERATGISIKELQQKTEKEQEEIGKKIEAKVRQKIATGMANALEYIFISRIEENLQKRKSYLKKGLDLLERNPHGIDGLLLVRFYLDIDELDKAKSVVDKNLSEAQNTLSLKEFIKLSSRMANIKSDTESLDVMNKLSKLNKQQAEAFFWLSFAERIAIHKAEMYEKLDLVQKAREEYLYLCNTFKNEDACKNAERLKNKENKSYHDYIQ